MVSFSRRSSYESTTPSNRYDQMKSAADALKGLKFITTPKPGEEGNHWNDVEKRFDKLTASTNGLLHSSMFGECIETMSIELRRTWMYLAVPVSLYTCERLIRAFRSSTETVEIIKSGKVFTIDTTKNMNYDEIFPVEAKTFGYKPKSSFESISLVAVIQTQSRINPPLS
ncbi:hypothetical protein Dsin_014503 [Dipteronia sinensis]|uniref:NADPH oxidase Respiratory burst domain-containing protein n=1 Tax=Dipteronia sinensis TaxID=43782 RepID=A0AAE0AMG7_9ROSI|nr:hypothetical protein Dsin_014503 [Dipteronia sinensis]